MVLHYGPWVIELFLYNRDLQTTAREAISFGSQKHFVNDEKIIY